MTFTEIVFEVGDERYPLCRMTAAPSQSSAVLRVVDPGKASGRFRTLITFYGTPEEAEDLPRQLRAYRQGGDLEVVHAAPGVVSLRTDSSTLDAGSGAGVRLLAVLRLLQAFGPDVMLEPFLFRRGRIRARVLVPRRVETPRVLLALQEVQRSSGFADFRVVRVNQLQAQRYVDLLRRILTPEQEELLRLAASMGYYDSPKGSTLEQIAARVGLSVSPVHKRLKTIEETLVSAHVEPSRAVQGVRRRRRRADPAFPAIAPLDVALRVRWSQSRLAQFTAAVPGSRALLQVLDVSPQARTTVFLLVLLAPEAEHARFLKEFEERPDVVAVETVEKDRAHASVKVTMRLSGRAGAPTFPFWEEAWGVDALPRPFVFEGGEVTVRFLLMRPLDEAVVRERLAACGKLAGWD
ncbi:MAG TPA: helix-turn-helix domain-containing protein, partial [Candidatus Thermoplasmatota archaeon]|nr:helix-turn-helix domain-containing protein [Candidatus Thermoplasmatota archaeon]